jgi:hypothetical protein
MMRGCFVEVPVELEESASIDGCACRQALSSDPAGRPQRHLRGRGVHRIFTWNDDIFVLVPGPRRGHDLHGPAVGLLQRPVDALGQDLGEERALHPVDLPRYREHAAPLNARHLARRHQG